MCHIYVVFMLYCKKGKNEKGKNYILQKGESKEKVKKKKKIAWSEGDGRVVKFIYILQVN